MERALQSNDQGQYSAAELPVGTYRVAVSNPGFKTEVRNGITLTIGASLQVDFTLNVGDVKETVEVTADTTQVETATSSMGGLVEERTIRELPLNGREWLQLTILEPGVATGTSSKDGSRGWGTSISVSGSVLTTLCIAWTGWW